MDIKKGNSLIDVKKMNRVFIKDCLYYVKSTTRQQISNELGLTLPTITTSVSEMIKDGYITEINDDEMSNSSVGRPAKLISYKADAFYTIGIELGPYETYAVLMDLQGNVLKSIVRVVADKSYELMLQKTTEIIHDLMEDVTVKVLGVGVGLPGFIDTKVGVIRSNFRADWSGRNLALDLQRKINMPVIVDNNVRLRAINYVRDNAFLKPHSFAYFYISKGIACPIMIKDYVLSGYTAGAGEVGHMTIKKDKEEYLLDNLSGELAIINKCKLIYNSDVESELKNICKFAEELTIAHIIDAYDKNDPVVSEIIDESIEYLGIALSNVVNLINPEFVVVDGYIMKSQKIVEKLKKIARVRFFGINEEEVHLNFISFKKFQSAKGAATIVIRKMFIEA